MLFESSYDDDVIVPIIDRVILFFKKGCRSKRTMRSMEIFTRILSVELFEGTVGRALPFEGTEIYDDEKSMEKFLPWPRRTIFSF